MRKCILTLRKDPDEEGPYNSLYGILNNPV